MGLISMRRFITNSHKNMVFVKTVIFCCALTCLEMVALADRRFEPSGEVLDQETPRFGNDTAADVAATAEIGPPDSHEAMNNRDIYPKIREKRSYEFLMGLINNNSRYEVTRVDPEITTRKPEVTTDNVVASEILLELMVRIAAHPDQWDKVHKLLRSIDQDLSTSRNVVDKLRKKADATSSANLTHIIASSKNEVIPKETSQPEEQRGASKDEQNITKKFEQENHQKDNEWPTFDDDRNNVKFINSNDNKRNDSKIPKYPWHDKANKPTYLKNFAYHRVTGKPINLNKNPKAYIAVSVIAPKSSKSRSNLEDVTLENELHQLKPWTHNQNLKNMESIRSRWVIRSEQDKKPSSL